MEKIGEVKACGEYLQVMLIQYASGGNGIQLLDQEGSPFATFSTTGPGNLLAADEFAAKTWGENEVLREPLLDSNLFSDTGKLIQCGFNTAEVWKIHAPRNG